MMKYFLTGATGFLGGRLARQLVEAGHRVIAVVRNPDKAKDLAELGIAIHQGDVTDKEGMRAPMTGVDGVFHVAAWYKIGVKDKREAGATNVQGTRNVLELMRELGIPKGVYTSTLGVNEDTGGQLVDETHRYTGPYFSKYTRTKAEAHRLAETFIADGLPLVIVMPGLIYGPGDTSSVRTTLLQYLQRQL
ncbi:MAG: NAD-dependent epimerase/dehydratase family protein, partial [Blastocatellia bacterium]